MLKIHGLLKHVSPLCNEIFPREQNKKMIIEITKLSDDEIC